eukprot:m.136858 g.136858  ORF g.136858 m.136858 type:complete len:69 (+) comp17581_c0_seq6:4426-4632(+)
MPCCPVHDRGVPRDVHTSMNTALQLAPMPSFTVQYIRVLVPMWTCASGFRPWQWVGGQPTAPSHRPAA